jgi:hypothetical protein
MSSLNEQIEVLRSDLTSEPMRISAYHDLPFVIFRHDPGEEYECRKRLRLLATTLSQNHGRRVTFISLAQLVWAAINKSSGLKSIVDLERDRGFGAAQQTVHNILAKPKFVPLAETLLAQLKSLDPVRDVVFLVRAAALAPAIYSCAALLNELHGKTMIPIVLFYPGSADGHTDLRFMNIQDRDTGPYNYRVKIYGGES